MALSGNSFDSYKPSKGARIHALMAAEHIYRGALVMTNAAGYVAKASDTSGCFTLGVALNEVDNSGGSAGDESILVDVGGAAIKVTHEDGSMAIANVGDAVYLEGDDEVTSAGTGTNDILAGQIESIVSATVVWVRLKPSGVIS